MKPTPLVSKPMPKGVRARIMSHYDELSDKHRLLANFIVESAAEVSLLSSAALGGKVGVSNATVVRFSQSLGYDGYIELKQDLLQDIKADLAPEERFRLIERRGSQHLLDRVVRQEADNINQTVSRLTARHLATVADLVCEARRVVVDGIGLSATMAQMLVYLLNEVRIDACTASADAVPVEERILRLTPRDLVISISLPPYSRSTIEHAEIAKAQGIPLLAITNADSAPVALIAARALVLATENVLFTNSVAAFAVVSNALVTEIAFRNRKRLVKENDRMRERLSSLYQ